MRCKNASATATATKKRSATAAQKQVGTTTGSAQNESGTGSCAEGDKIIALDAKTGALVLSSERTTTPTGAAGAASTQSLSKVIRQLVWNKYVGERNGLGTCWCCRNKTISAFEFEAGHVIPRAKGGPDTVENLRPICSLCNKSMGTENMFDYQKRQNLGPSPSQKAWEWICTAVSLIPIRFGW